MDATTMVSKVIPKWGSKGLTISQINLKVPGLTKRDVAVALKELFDTAKVESIECGNAPKKYRSCNGVEL